MVLAPHQLLLRVTPRIRFLGSIREIVNDQRFIWTPNLGDRTTVLDDSPYRHPITWSADPSSGLLVPQGDGYLQTFTPASSHRGTVPDHDAFTFSNGTADLPFSIVALGNLTNTAVSRVLLGHYAASNTEWFYNVGTTDLPAMRIIDDSAAITVSRTADAATTMGSLRLFGMTFSAVSAFGSAGNDITHWLDATAVASTAANNASYAGMENKAGILEIGALTNGSFWDGSLGSMILCGGALTTGKMLDLKTAHNTYFRTAL